jgi:hypothetical protein
MIEPEHPTEKYMLGRISFHESQAEWFFQHDQITLAAWARSVAEMWSKRLETLQTTERLVRSERERR